MPRKIPKCPFCKCVLDKEFEAVGDPNARKLPPHLPQKKVYNLHCHECDRYFAQYWKNLWFRSLKDSAKDGEKLRESRSKADPSATDIDKSAPYCLIRRYTDEFHIQIPEDFHSFYMDYKKRLKESE